jgi:hypothetical protein
MTAQRSKKKRGQEEIYETEHPQPQRRDGRKTFYFQTAATSSTPEASPSYVSPYNCPKTLLSQEEIALLVLSNNFLSSISGQSLETDPCFESSFQSSYAMERFFLEHYVSLYFSLPKGRSMMIQIGNQNSIHTILQEAKRSERVPLYSTTLREVGTREWSEERSIPHEWPGVCLGGMPRGRGE